MKRFISPIFFVLMIVGIIGLLKYEHAGPDPYSGMHELRATVTGVDNSALVEMGTARIGGQHVTAILMEGEVKGQTVIGVNQLTGQPEMDEIFHPGDTILMAVRINDGKAVEARAVNQYRQGWELALFGLFVVILLIYARSIGLKALFSFITSFYIIWKFFIPGLLGGGSPILLTVVTLTLLTVVIITCVAGFSRVTVVAILGTLSGLLLALGLTLFFGAKLKMAGMTAPFATMLIFSGHYTLDLLDIFYASVILGASGAAMDIAMDVAASMNEVLDKKPDITRNELIKSGFNVGRMVTGTMTTTLLLAYSGGYLTMLMLFVTKGTSFTRMLNFKLVAAEIFRTLVGSVGLVLVAPITAILAGFILCGFKEIKKASN
ncbi:YibE/F family protein [Maridesulfovibrio salexigens]|uniref:YibE/F family protein n=1 Tax=Maridesulfovibrio salexigens (strain ATCC 14822 / DSM 2638 / NCIMB 8403 / VKM B-1763) TaxID=526222 RepID=C6BVD7_MARSD|nr:YibE/F family protein [Maridesulfovibrio salexigens]ACS80112.1 YibE/F family protein [Maridesulfovibrio salexigens DSM 2638]